MVKTTWPAPDITDADIAWVADLMHLDLDDERKHFLKCNTSIDVAACPGSGKTTLVVAKLAMLARKWPYRTKGICVLSHTNVAQEEIETRLANVPNGSSLLSYPHFIGTIHAFANRFLALPYLRSQGCIDIVINDNLTNELRQKKIVPYWRTIIDNRLGKYNSLSDVRICDALLNYQPNTRQFEQLPQKAKEEIKRVLELSKSLGYFCYDEMFVWARALLEKEQQFCGWLSERFPIVIIDEVQDTNQEQGDLLRRIFPLSSSTIIQRVGDENQAIYNYLDEAEGSSMGFPQDGYHSLSNSFRFGKGIARIAAPFALAPVLPKLIGRGPCKHLDCPSNHTIFIFPQSDPSRVLQSFGELALTTFKDEQLRSKHPVIAVGGVHKRDEDATKPEHFPKSVCHYWHNYLAENHAKKEHYRTLSEYFISAQRVVQTGGCFGTGANMIASGIVRLAKLTGNSLPTARRNAHRALLASIEELPGKLDAMYLKDKYKHFLLDTLLNDVHAMERGWDTIREELNSIFSICFEKPIDFCGEYPFLQWEKSACIPEKANPTFSKPNVCTVEKDGRKVDIHLDSIHGVKGQTHLATLVLETYWYGHFFSELMPWLIDGKPKKSGKRNNTRLRQAYVAMTRPTHLLCLAIPDSSLNAKGDLDLNIQSLQNRGWRIHRL